MAKVTANARTIAVPATTAQATLICRQQCGNRVGLKIKCGPGEDARFSAVVLAFGSNNAYPMTFTLHGGEVLSFDVPDSCPQDAVYVVSGSEEAEQVYVIETLREP